LSRSFVAASSQFFHVGDNLDASGSQWSVSAWIKPSSGSIGAGTRRVIISKEESGAAAGWAFEVDDTGLVQFGMYNGVYFTALSSSEPTEGSWQHIGGTYIGDPTEELKIYFGGSLQDTDVGPDTPSGSTQNLTIGKAAHESGRFFDGLIAELAIWDVRLTDGNMASLATPGTVPTTIGSPIAYWSLRDDLTESVGGLTPTDSGTTQSSDHPWSEGGYLLVAN
jgi:hypothetical protein